MAEETSHRQEQLHQALSTLRQQLKALALSPSQHAALMVTLNQIAALNGFPKEEGPHPSSGTFTCPEQELLQNVSFIEQVVDTSPQLLYIVDLEQFVNLYVNQQVETILGYTVAEVQQQGAQFFVTLIHPEDESSTQAHFQRLLSDPGRGVFEVEYRARHADGTYRWLQSREMVFKRNSQGDVTQVLGMAIDVTHRKQAEMQLRASEEQLRQIVDHINGCFFLRSAETGETLYISVGYERLYGRPREELYHDPQAWINAAHPEDCDRIRAQAAAEQQGQYFFNDEYRIVLPDGTVRWIWSLSFPIYDETGHMHRFGGFVHDITERKAIETDLRSSLQEKDVLLAEVHHRVKNNLQIVSSLLELQANRVGDETAQAALIDSQNRVIAMALIHETLYHSGNLACINFGEYIQRLASGLFRAYDSATTLALNLETESCLTLPSDIAISLGLILNELVTNALKHGEFRYLGGTLEIGLRPIDQANYGLWVSHPGDCLPDDFELETSSSMGLKLVRLLVNRIHGRLRVTRTPRTTFTVEFAVEPSSP
ncbi:MAG TPA: PAS domain-containing protein [Trichocoleus sp.]